MFSLHPQIRSVSLKKSLVKSMEKNICRNEAIIKLSELSSYLYYISFSYSKYPSISKLLKYFPRKPSVSQNLQLLSMATPLQKGALSNDLKGVVAKIFPGANPRTPILLASLVFGISTPNMNFVRTGLTTEPHPRKIVLFTMVNMDPIRT